MSIQSVERAWQELAGRSDLIGKEVVFDNRVGDTDDKKTLSKIEVKDGFVMIYSGEGRTEAAYEGNISPEPFIRFKLDEERDPHQVGDTIFCDLDERRQIRIAT